MLKISCCFLHCSASVFGEHNKLAPIHPERLAMWRREMEWLLCVTDYIVELVPAWHTSAGGVLKEVTISPTPPPLFPPSPLPSPPSLSPQVMVHKQRADLHANLPALRKLDTMLLVRFHRVNFL